MKRIFKFFILILSIISIIILLNFNKLKIKYLSKNTGYQETTINTLIEIELFDNIENKDYSATLDKIINTIYFKKELINEYLNILYIDRETFLNNIDNMLEKGYNSKEINVIFQRLSQDNINILLKEEYLSNIIDLIETSYFKEKNFKRYLSYLSTNKNKEIETIITNVNIGIDNKFYTNINNIEKQDDPLVLVNKYHKLDTNYIPKDLQKVSAGSATLQKEAKIAFDNMCKDARKENVILYGGSGYRSYNHQKNLYNNYVKQDGKSKADTYSARPGHSEHQTGLAIDIIKSSGHFVYETDKEFTWLTNNAYKYGFILRYPKGKENITGYMYEPWHYRYLGTDIAKEIYELNITYEEYVAKK